MFRLASMIGLVLLALSLTPAVEAEIRRHVIGGEGYAPDELIDALKRNLEASSFTSSQSERSETVSNLDVSFNVKVYEMRFTRSSDRYEISAFFFFLEEPDRSRIAPLNVHVGQNYGYSGNTIVDIGNDLGVMSWSEYDPKTNLYAPQLLDTELSLWRDEYIDAP